MKSLALIAAMALTLMAAGCMQHQQAQIGGAKGEPPEACPKPDPLRYEPQTNTPKDVLFMGIAWFCVIILLAIVWIVLDV
jgi:hypothetical protein